MNVQMIGNFYDTGFEGVSTYVDCWPCASCGRVWPVGSCRDADGSIVEIDAFCEECDVEYEYTSVRPDGRRQFQFSSGEQGWWSAP